MAQRPYTIPHGEEGAGLRAYFPSTSDVYPRPPVTWPSWIVIVAFLAGIFLGARVAAAAPPAVRFIQPRVAIAIAPITGIEIPVQIRIEPHAANRAYAITWCDGAHAHSLDGADDAAIQPMARPLTVRLGAGDCEFVATVFGAGSAVRARTSFVMHVCGAQEEGCVRGNEDR